MSNKYSQGQNGKGNNSCAAITSTRDSVIDSAVGHMEFIASIVMHVRRGQLEGKDGVIFTRYWLWWSSGEKRFS